MIKRSSNFISSMSICWSMNSSILLLISSYFNSFCPTYVAIQILLSQPFWWMFENSRLVTKRVKHICIYRFIIYCCYPFLTSNSQSKRWLFCCSKTDWRWETKRFSSEAPAESLAPLFHKLAMPSKLREEWMAVIMTTTMFLKGVLSWLSFTKIFRESWEDKNKSAEVTLEGFFLPSKAWDVLWWNCDTQKTGTLPARVSAVFLLLFPQHFLRIPANKNPGRYIGV